MFQTFLSFTLLLCAVYALGQREANPGMIEIYRSFGGDYQTEYPHDHPLHKNKKGAAPHDGSVFSKKPIYTITKGCHLYQNFSPSSKVLAKIPIDATVKVIDSRFGNYWQVYYQKQIGYIDSKMLTYHNQNNISSTPIARNENIPHDLVESFYDGKPHYTTRRALSLYTARTINASVQTRIPSGAMVRVVNSFGNEWWEIRYQGYHGFVCEKDLTYFSSAVPDATIPIGNYKNNLGMRTNLYPDAPIYKLTTSVVIKARMSHQSEIIMEIPAYEEIKIIDNSFGFWWKIYFRGTTGFLNSEFLNHEALQYQAPKDIALLQGTSQSYRILQPAAFRVEPSRTAFIIDEIPAEEVIQVIETATGKWIKALYRGKVGYLFNPLLMEN